MRGRRLLVAAVMLALLWSGCEREAEREGPKTLVVLAGPDVDSIDPGSTDLAVVHNLLSSVHRALYAIRPGRGLRPEPDLATGPPEVSADGRTVTYRLRPGVRFAPPVDREIVAADLEYGLERLFLPSVQNSLAAQVLGNVVGAAAASKGRRGDIAGIEAPDERTLVLRFTDGSARAEPPLLILPFGVPVPRQYAERFDRGRRSAYFRHQIATGPYRVEADASGRITPRGYTPGRGLRLVRNPNWSRATDVRPAPVDVIEYRTGNDNAPVTIRRILAGRGMVASAVAVPPSLIQRMDARERTDRFFRPVQDALMLLALNVARPPFDDVRIRRAVLAAVDREALVQAVGGPFLGVPASHHIPPAVRGHRESNAAAAEVAAPEALDRFIGDLPARERRIRVVVPARFGRPAEALQESLTRMGFRVELTRVADAALTTLCGSRRRAGEACLFGIVYGVHDPAPILSLLAESSSPLNFAFLRSSAVDRALGEAQAVGGAARAGAWADVNRLILDQAALVPLLWVHRAIAHSPDVRPQGVTDIDYAYTDIE